ncbi:MAG: hypothetical protein JSS20_03020 [Proteobacteria bacterium]|nr:hypothetical protein [Pseudomonadota bacterium]
MIKAFIAGALGVVVFQLALGAALYAAGLSGSAPYPMAPTAPFGVPQTVSYAFWGGLWGIVLWLVLRNMSGAGYWLTAILFGGIVVSAVLLFVVFPIKGRPLTVLSNPKALATIFSLHATFGLGTAVFLRLLGAARA